jgi:type IV secretory pathway TrbL component
MIGTPAPRPLRVRWARVRAELAAGRLSHRQAARRLGIGTATLGRLLTTEQGGISVPAVPEGVAAGPDDGATPSPSGSRPRGASRKARTPAERAARAPRARSRRSRATTRRGSRHG